MASVNWEKFKTATEVKAMFRHCDSDERLMREHSNKHVDKSLTSQNLCFLCDDEGDGTSYEKMCAMYDELIESLDMTTNTNKRKDRVTCVGWNIPLPESIHKQGDKDEMDRWFSYVWENLKLNKDYAEGLIGGYVHYDEVHEYYVEGKDGEVEKKESRPHLQVYCVPVVNGKLNCFKFSSRANINKMNRFVEDVTNDFFPGHKFMTGEKTKSKKTVEELKDESEVVKKAFEESTRIIADAQKDARECAQTVFNEELEELRTKERETRQKASESLEALSHAYELAKQSYENSKDDVKEFLMKWNVPNKTTGKTETLYDVYRRDVLSTRESEITKRERGLVINKLRYDSVAGLYNKVYNPDGETGRDETEQSL